MAPGAPAVDISGMPTPPDISSMPVPPSQADQVNAAVADTHTLGDAASDAIFHMSGANAVATHGAWLTGRATDLIGHMLAGTNTDYADQWHKGVTDYFAPKGELSKQVLAAPGEGLAAGARDVSAITPEPVKDFVRAGLKYGASLGHDAASIVDQGMRSVFGDDFVTSANQVAGHTIAAGAAALPFGQAGAATRAAMRVAGEAAAPTEAATLAKVPTLHPADHLMSEGVPLNVAQATGSKIAQHIDRASQMLTPGAANFAEAQSQALNRAFLRPVGVTDPAVTHADPKVLSEAHDRITGVMDDVAARSQTVFDTDLARDIKAVTDSLPGRVPASEQGPILQNVQDLMTAASKSGEGAELPGKVVQNIRSNLGSLMKNPHLSDAAADLHDALNDAVARGATPEDVKALATARQQYRALKQIEPAVDAATGNISPSKLMNSLSTAKNRKMTLYGRGDQSLVSLAKSAKQVIPDKLPNSGTAERFIPLLTMLEGLSTVAGHGVGHMLAGALAPAAGATTVASAARILRAQSIVRAARAMSRESPAFAGEATGGRAATTPRTPSAGAPGLGPRALGGKQGGAIGDVSKPGIKNAFHEPERITHEHDPETGEHVIRSTNGVTHATDTADGGLRVTRSDTIGPFASKGEGTQRMKFAADLAQSRNAPLHSDISLSEGAAKTYTNLRDVGYDVRKNPGATVNPETKNLVSDDRSRGVFTVHPKPVDTRTLGERIGGGKQRGGPKFSPKAPAAASEPAATERPMEGAPTEVNIGGKLTPVGPHPVARAAAAAYQKSTGIGGPAPTTFEPITPEHRHAVARAYDEMPHNPSDPKVAAAYDALIRETKGQWDAIKGTGLKVDFKGAEDYPYGANPREAVEDIKHNNHLSVFKTEAGEGGASEMPKDHPLAGDSGVTIGDRQLTNNDLFRVVHDYFGHAKEGNGFRGDGEYNAYRIHKAMYSPEAQKALATETLGQNAWVNDQPKNLGASQVATTYAEQKAGLLPAHVTGDVVQHLTEPERAQMRSGMAQRVTDLYHQMPGDEELGAMALEGQAKKGWYADVHHANNVVYGADAPRFNALTAALSPRSVVRPNFVNATKIFTAWDEAGRPTTESAIRGIFRQEGVPQLEAHVQNAIRALQHDNPGDLLMGLPKDHPMQMMLSGPKVDSFMHNLQGDSEATTLDGWMARIFGVDQAKFQGSATAGGPGKSATYLAASARLRSAAKYLTRMTGDKWTPAELQETTWSWIKTVMEHSGLNDKSIPELLKSGVITDELIKGTADFHSLYTDPEITAPLRRSKFAGGLRTLHAAEGSAPVAPAASQARHAAQVHLRPALMRAAERLETQRHAGTNFLFGDNT